MKVKEFLDKSGVKYELTHHVPAHSAQKVAAHEHEKGRYVAKPVIVMVDEKPVMCVLAAPHRVVMDKLREHFDTDKLRLAEEDEIRQLFPDCDDGAEPPLGNLYGLRTLMDEWLLTDDHIVFQAGKADAAVHMSMDDFREVAKPDIVDFAWHKSRQL